MILHEQHSDQSKVFYALDITDNGNGTITCPAGSIWVDGAAYRLPTATLFVGTQAFRLAIERVGEVADYVLDFTGEGGMTAFRPHLLPLVAWRDRAGDEMHVLRHLDA